MGTDGAWTCRVAAVGAGAFAAAAYFFRAFSRCAWQESPREPRGAERSGSTRATCRPEADAHRSRPMRMIGWLAVTGAGLYALHRLAVWMENRRWIYYRRSGDPGSLGNAFLHVQAMLEPGTTPGPAPPPGRSR